MLSAWRKDNDGQAVNCHRSTSRTFVTDGFILSVNELTLPFPKPVSYAKVLSFPYADTNDAHFICPAAPCPQSQLCPGRAVLPEKTGQAGLFHHGRCALVKEIGALLVYIRNNGR